MDDILSTTLQWFAAAKQQPAMPTPDARQVSFYLGMQLEELGEKLSLISPTDGAWLKGVAMAYKTGMNDGAVGEALRDNPTELLDADIDLLWVSMGAGRAAGADVIGALGAVSEANWNKRWDDNEFHINPVDNKVMKPDGWTAPDLTAYVHPSLRPAVTDVDFREVE